MPTCLYLKILKERQTVHKTFEIPLDIPDVTIEKAETNRHGDVVITVKSTIELPIRSIDFYYSEFQAATVRISRDKSKTCFLEPTWMNLFHNLLNLLGIFIYSMTIKSNNFPRGCSMSVEGSNAAILVHKLIEEFNRSKNSIKIVFYILKNRFDLIRYILT